jgi:opacity protein-like surface antigen
MVQPLLAQDKTNEEPAFTSVEERQLRKDFFELGYDDAEAGFNGVYLGGQYHYNAQFDAVAETAFLRGHSVNYKRLFLGAHYLINHNLNLNIPINFLARGGLSYASFKDDSEYGLLLGARTIAGLTSKIRLEFGLDWNSAGENSMLWIFGARYTLNDSLYLHSKYYLSDFDELTLGVGYYF